jgi:hypothetical protein
MLRKIIILLLISFSNFAYSQDEITITKLVKLKTPDTEVSDAILYLDKIRKEVSEKDASYIRFFSTYAIKDESQRDNVALLLSFLTHSMSGVVTKEYPGGGYNPLAYVDEYGKFVKVQNVPESDTLWWIDLRDFNWTEQAWENISKTDGYFVEPVVTHEKYSLMRLYAGNAVMRADWFIQHASSIMKQVDVDSKTKIYKELLYSTLKKAPQTVKEFELTWGIDTQKARDIGNAFGTLVTESQNVARHNRILFGYRTELGWYYRTYDVKNVRGRRDYAENILDFKGNPPDIFDVGEIFATNSLKMQVYDLYDSKENLVDFGDPAIVRHMSDVIADARVRTPHSCFDCHASGPIPSENTLLSYIKARAKASTYYKEDQLRIDRVYLDNRFEDSISENQAAFAKSLLKINGLKPEENGRLYLNQILEYEKPLTLEQVAWECGVTPEQYVEKISNDNKGHNERVPFRVSNLIKTGQPINREAWESSGADGQPGLFQQSMIMIHGLTKITDTNENIIKNIVVAISDGEVRTKNELIKKFKVGDEFETTGQITNGWIGVKVDGKDGYVRQTEVKNK